MTPQEEQGYLENRFTEACDDCGQGADAHAAWTNSQDVIVVDCTND